MKNSIVRMADLKQWVQLSKSQIYTLVARGEFPRPFKLGKRASAWDAQAVSNWIESRKAAQ